MILQDADNIGNQLLSLKVVVAGNTPDGHPDLVPIRVICLRCQYTLGEHYASAERKAFPRGGQMVSFDEHDTASFKLIPLFEWDHAPVIDISKDRSLFDNSQS